MPSNRRRPPKQPPKINDKMKKARGLDLAKRAKEVGRQRGGDYRDG